MKISIAILVLLIISLALAEEKTKLNANADDTLLLVEKRSVNDEAYTGMEAAKAPNDQTNRQHHRTQRQALNPRRNGPYKESHRVANVRIKNKRDSGVEYEGRNYNGEIVPPKSNSHYSVHRYQTAIPIYSTWRPTHPVWWMPPTRPTWPIKLSTPSTEWRTRLAPEGPDAPISRIVWPWKWIKGTKTPTTELPRTHFTPANQTFPVWYTPEPTKGTFWGRDTHPVRLGAPNDKESGEIESNESLLYDDDDKEPKNNNDERNPVHSIKEIEPSEHDHAKDDKNNDDPSIRSLFGVSSYNDKESLAANRKPIAQVMPVFSDNTGDHTTRFELPTNNLADSHETSDLADKISEVAGFDSDAERGAELDYPNSQDFEGFPIADNLQSSKQHPPYFDNVRGNFRGNPPDGLVVYPFRYPHYYKPFVVDEQNRTGKKKREA